METKLSLFSRCFALFNQLLNAEESRQATIF